MAALRLGIPVEDYAREVGGPFFARLPDHAPEDADTGLPMTEGVRSANLIDPTPIGARGVSTITTSELRALIGDREASASGELPLLVSTNCSNCLRVAIPGTNFVPNRIETECWTMRNVKPSKPWPTGCFMAIGHDA
jgi:hypothetical protein